MRQNRWKVGFRLVLVVPAVFLLAAFFGSGGSFSANSSGGEVQGTGLLLAAAILGWFFALFRGRVPRGLRDLIAYGLSYAAQVWAYMTLLTDRYPSSDPLTAIGQLPFGKIRFASNPATICGATGSRSSSGCCSSFRT